MAEETPETPKGPSVLENPSAWLAERLQKADAEEPASEPSAPALSTEPTATAEPSPAEPSEAPQPQTTWRDQRFPEDDPEVHGFFRGKPLPEVLKSYGHAERKIQEQGHEISTLRTELAAFKALKEIMTPAQAPAKPKTLKDRFADYGVDLDTDSIVNPEKVEMARLEILKQEQAAQVEARLATERGKADEQTFIQRSLQAAEAARAELGIEPPDYGPRAYAVMNMIRQFHPEDHQQVLQDPEAYKHYYKYLYGEPAKPVETPAQIPPPPAAPVAPNPPGVKRSGTVAPQDSVPKLGAEQLRIIQDYGRAAGFKGEQLDRYVERSRIALAQMEKR